MRRTVRRSQAGFSLIELLITVVVIGVVASIALFALLHALDKAKQKASIGDMRSISKALEIYSIDHGFLPTAADMNVLRTLLTPYQSTVLPVQDHWRHMYGYSKDDAGNYSIECYGKDGVNGADITRATRNDFTRDIILSNGMFAASPE